MSAPSVFVYGTLLAGESRAGMLAGLRRRRGTVRGRLYHMPAGYPALCLNGDDVIHGEIVDPPNDAVLALIDQFEGVAEGLYQRSQIRAVLGGMMSVKCWSWTMADPVARGGLYLPHGVWRGFRRR